MGRRAAAFLFGGCGASLVSIKEEQPGNTRFWWTILLTTVLALPVVALPIWRFGTGRQVRAGDGLPMVPTPDSVAAIEFSSTKAPRVIGMLNVCATQMGPPSAIAVAPDYSFALSACPQKFGPDGKLTAESTVAVIGLDDPTRPNAGAVQAGWALPAFIWTRIALCPGDRGGRRHHHALHDQRIVS